MLNSSSWDHTDISLIRTHCMTLLLRCLAATITCQACFETRPCFRQVSTTILFTLFYGLCLPCCTLCVCAVRVLLSQTQSPTGNRNIPRARGKSKYKHQAGSFSVSSIPSTIRHRPYNQRNRTITSQQEHKGDAASGSSQEAASFEE